MWRDLLTLSRREQLGIIGLFIILIVIMTGPLVFSSEEEVEIPQEFITWADSAHIEHSSKHQVQKDTLFAFNPNSESVKNLQLLGFSNQAIINLLKYREAGGSIKTPSKLKEIYGVDSALFYKLEPYIVITASNDNFKESHFKSKKQKRKVNLDFNDERELTKKKVASDSFKIELNSADTAELKLLKGIGPVLSLRIVNYRKKIGGYYSVDQLKEVYGLSDEVVDHNKPYLMVDERLVVPMDISKAGLKQMKNHPYLSFYMAKEVYEARKAKQLTSIKQFVDNEAFTNADTARLRRYFVVCKEGK